MEETVDLPAQARGGTLAPETWNPEARTIDVVASTGARVLRFDWLTERTFEEELAVTPDAVMLDRLNRGGPVLDSHQAYSLENQIGVVVPGSARIEGGELRATLKLSAREDVDWIVRDIADGVIRNLSIGYETHAYEVERRQGAPDLWRATRWTPFEISFVPVPADAAAQVRTRDKDTGQGGFPCVIRRPDIPAAPVEVPAMEQTEDLAGAPAPAAPAAPESVRLATGRLRSMVRNAGLPADVEANLLARHADAPFETEEDAMEEIRAADAALARTRVPTGGAPAVVTVDASEKLARAAVSAMSHRVAGKRAPLEDGGEYFRGRPFREVWAELAGINVRGLAPVQLVDRLLATRAIHTTSDFPQLMASVQNKFLRATYEDMAPNFGGFVRTREVRDFKQIVSAGLSAPPRLEALPAGGEIRWGTYAEEGEIYAVATYAAGFTVTRQMLVNDDLGAFGSFASGWAFRAREVEHDLVYTTILMGNPQMRVGGALFQTGAARGGNLASTGTTIDVTNVGAGRAVMRKQVGPSGERMNAFPTHIIVGPDRETLAEQVVNPNLVPTTSAGVNPFAGRTQVIVDPRITGNVWFLADGAELRRPIEMAYLEGASGPIINEFPEVTRDGLSFNALFDVGAAPVEYRTIYRNPGA